MVTQSATNPDENTLRQAIANAPDDDAPRLAYADWLQQQDQADRAEFIRVQCQLAKLPAWDEHRDALEIREDQLLQLHRKEWEAPIISAFPDSQPLKPYCTFKRGLIDSIGVYRDNSFTEEEIPEEYRKYMSEHPRELWPGPEYTGRYPEKKPYPRFPMEDYVERMGKLIEQEPQIAGIS